MLINGLPDAALFIEVGIFEAVIMVLAAEVWLLMGGMNKRKGGQNGP